MIRCVIVYLSQAYCVGGDVRSIVESVKNLGVSKEEGRSLSADFFREEYQLNHLISTLQTPYIACILIMPIKF